MEEKEDDVYSQHHIPPQEVESRGSSSSPSYTPQYIVTEPNVRRSRRLAEKQVRRQGLATRAVEAFMDVHAELWDL